MTVQVKPVWGAKTAQSFVLNIYWHFRGRFAEGSWKVHRFAEGRPPNLGTFRAKFAEQRIVLGFRLCGFCQKQCLYSQHVHAHSLLEATFHNFQKQLARVYAAEASRKTSIQA